MKDFGQMTVAEMEEFKRSGLPMYSYRFSALAAHVGNISPTPFDGDHTTEENRTKAIARIIKELTKIGYINISQPELFIRKSLSND